MGNWGKLKQKLILNRDIVSPFNSRELLVQLTAQKENTEFTLQYLYNLILLNYQRKEY